MDFTEKNKPNLNRKLGMDSIKKILLVAAITIACYVALPIASIAQVKGYAPVNGLKDGGWDGAGKSKSQLAILPGLTHYNIFMNSALSSAIISFLNSRSIGESISPANNSNKVDLVFTRIFNAPVHKVWKAWSESEYIKQWWGPNGFTCSLAKIDFRENGTSLVCMNSPQFGDMYSTWKYKTIIPKQQIEYIHNLADKDGNKIDPASVGMPSDFPQDQRQLIIFKDLGEGKTELTVTEYGWTAGQMMEMSKMGMEQCLDKMEQVVTSK